MELEPHFEAFSVTGGYVVKRITPIPDGWTEELFCCTSIKECQKHLAECMKAVDAHEETPDSVGKHSR